MFNFEYLTRDLKKEKFSLKMKPPENANKYFIHTPKSHQQWEIQQKPSRSNFLLEGNLSTDEKRPWHQVTQSTTMYL